LDVLAQQTERPEVVIEARVEAGLAQMGEHRASRIGGRGQVAEDRALPPAAERRQLRGSGGGGGGGRPGAAVAGAGGEVQAQRSERAERLGLEGLNEE